MWYQNILKEQKCQTQLFLTTTCIKSTVETTINMGNRKQSIWLMLANMLTLKIRKAFILLISQFYILIFMKKLLQATLRKIFLRMKSGQSKVFRNKSKIDYSLENPKPEESLYKSHLSLF